MTRPTRRLFAIIDVMPILKKIEGKNWTRDIQKEFEEDLGKAQVKTHGKVRDDAGGKRTWAAYPKIFGFWYEYNEKVKLTPAAENILVGGETAIRQLQHQILRFQWPNRVQEVKAQQMDPGFRIFPYRFLIKLLLDDRIRFLLTGEIAMFVLQAKTEDEYESIVQQILRYRRKRESDSITPVARKELIEAHKKLRPSRASDPEYTNETHAKYILDLANTFMNHLEIFKEIVHEVYRQGGPEKQISIIPEEINSMKSLVSYYDSKYRLLNTFPSQDKKFFIESYGNKFDRQKASRKTTKPMTKRGKDVEQVRKAYEKVMQENLSPQREEIIRMISENTGKRESVIKEIISSNSGYFDFDQANNDQFAKLYLQIAPDGTKYAEFEEMTRKIFASFGFPTKKLWFPKKTGGGLEIDGLVVDTDRLLSGIVDAKSGKKFSCNNKEVGVMEAYIRSFKQYHDGEKTYHLDFFAYVYGKKFENTPNFRSIIGESGVSGAIISARELLRIREMFQSGSISKSQIWNLFKSNKEIML